MHYYQFSIGDYRAATTHLSNDEDLAYRRLLDMYYDTEKPIPTDTTWVARRLRVCVNVVLSVLEDMFTLTEEGWRHARCDDVIAQYHAMAEKNRANGKRGGRKKNPVGNDSEPIAKATINHKQVNQESFVDALPVGKAKAKRLLPDWQLPKPWGEWALDAMTWDAATVRLEADKFKDHWIAKSGKDATKLDWEATWRNWCRNARPAKQSFAQQAADIARTTVPPAHKGPDPVLLKIEEDRKKAAPMPAHIRQQINSVLRKA